MAIDKKELRALVGALESAEYRYARTLAHDPHYYTLRRDWRGEMPFDEVVRALRARSEAVPIGTKAAAM